MGRKATKFHFLTFLYERCAVDQRELTNAGMGDRKYLRDIEGGMFYPIQISTYPVYEHGSEERLRKIKDQQSRDSDNSLKCTSQCIFMSLLVRN